MNLAASIEELEELCDALGKRVRRLFKKPGLDAAGRKELGEYRQTLKLKADFYARQAATIDEAMFNQVVLDVIAGVDPATAERIIEQLKKIEVAGEDQADEWDPGPGDDDIEDVPG